MQVKKKIIRNSFSKTQKKNYLIIITKFIHHLGKKGFRCLRVFCYLFFSLKNRDEWNSIIISHLIIPEFRTDLDIRYDKANSSLIIAKTEEKKKIISLFKIVSSLISPRHVI